MVALGCSSESTSEPMAMNDGGTKTDDMVVCGGEVCEAPETSCQDENTLLMFGDSVCDPKLNECTYSRQEVECEFGCFEGACAPTAELVQIKDTDHVRQDKYGEEFATDGNTLVVSSLKRSGEVYRFYVRDGATWREDQVVDLDYRALFLKMAIEDDLLVLASKTDSGCEAGIVDGELGAGCHWSGSAIIVERQEDGSWARSATLKSNFPVQQHGFGTDVAISNGKVYVGAPNDASCGLGANPESSDRDCARSGAIYVYEKQDGAWRQSDLLKAPTASTAFGFDIEVQDERILSLIGRTNVSEECFGEPECRMEDGNLICDGQIEGCTFDEGGLYVVEALESDWSYTFIPRSDDEANFMQFRFSTKSSDRFAASMRSPEETFIATYEKNGDVWVRTNHFAIEDLDRVDRFHWYPLAYADDVIYFGLPYGVANTEDAPVNWRSVYGAVRQYTPNADGEWSLRQELFAPVVYTRFGHRLEISEDELFVAAPEDSTANTGVTAKDDITTTVFDDDVQTYRSGAVYILGRAQIEN